MATPRRSWNARPSEPRAAPEGHAALAPGGGVVILEQLPDAAPTPLFRTFMTLVGDTATCAEIGAHRRDARA